MVPAWSAIKSCTEQKPQNAKRSVGSRAISIFRCQPPICVQSTFESSLPLAPTILLFEVPSLRVMCQFVIPILHQQTDFAFLEVILSQETSLFNEFSTFQNFALKPETASSMKTLASPKLVENKFSGTSRGSSLVRLEKLYRAAASNRKIIGWVASNLNFSMSKLHLCPAHL